MAKWKDFLKIFAVDKKIIFYVFLMQIFPRQNIADRIAIVFCHIVFGPIIAVGWFFNRQQLSQIKFLYFCE